MVAQENEPRIKSYCLVKFFKQFRLVPKQFDLLVLSMKEMMKRVRYEERQLQKILVDIAGMPKDGF